MNRHSYNRHARRSAAAQKVTATCKACDAACPVHVLKRRAIYASDPTAPSDLGCCKGCACAVGVCPACGETDSHWLGCVVVGLPAGPEARVVVH